MENIHNNIRKVSILVILITFLALLLSTACKKVSNEDAYKELKEISHTDTKDASDINIQLDKVKGVITTDKDLKKAKEHLIKSLENKVESYTNDGRFKEYNEISWVHKETFDKYMKEYDSGYTGL